MHWERGGGLNCHEKSKWRAPKVLINLLLFALLNDRLHTIISNEKKGREETEEAMLEMLRDMINRMKGEIDSERKDR